MVKAVLLLLLWVATESCPASDGSTVAPFFVDLASTEASASGSICAPFLTLESALQNASSLSEATISLQSRASIPAWSIEKGVVLLGNNNVLDFEGIISVPGSLEISQTQLTSNIEADFVFDVTGSLLLHACNITSFHSLPINIRGQVIVTNSLFANNARGVFASFAFGGNLTVNESQFFRNAAYSGAVFFLWPAGELNPTQYLISNCDFKENGSKGGSSVLVLNEYTTPSNVENQKIIFLKSNFSGHPTPTFQLTSKQFSLYIRGGKFENETQIVTGSLIKTNVTITEIEARKCKGPLFVLQLQGVFSLASSNFTDIESGPLVAATGAGGYFSLVFLNQVRVFNISNFNMDIRGVLLYARDTTCWLDNVHLENFTSSHVGVFDFIRSILFSQHFSAKNGTSISRIVGSCQFSSFTMQNTSIEALKSGGTMLSVSRSTINITRIIYRNLAGVLDPALKAYVTNLFSLSSRSNALITELDIKTIVTGSSLFYAFNSSLTLSNSVIAGPGGVPTFACNGGVFIMRDVVFNFTTSRSIIRGVAGGYFDIDRMVLRDMLLSSAICTLSSESTVLIHTLVLNNVTCASVTSGQHFSIAIDEVVVEKSRMGTLVDSGIAV